MKDRCFKEVVVLESWEASRGARTRSCIAMPPALGAEVATRTDEEGGGAPAVKLDRTCVTGDIGRVGETRLRGVPVRVAAGEGSTGDGAGTAGEGAGECEASTSWA